MAAVPTFALPPNFLAIAHRGIDASFCIAGIPFDIGTTNRSGARFGPTAIRHASRMLVDGDHPHWWIDPAALSVADIGDFRIALGDIPKSLSLIEEQAAVVEHLRAAGLDASVRTVAPTVEDVFISFVDKERKARLRRQLGAF